MGNTLSFVPRQRYRRSSVRTCSKHSPHCMETQPFEPSVQHTVNKLVLQTKKKKKDALSSKGRALPCLLQPVPKCQHRPQSAPSPKACPYKAFPPLSNFMRCPAPAQLLLSLSPRCHPACPSFPWCKTPASSSNPPEAPSLSPCPGPVHQASRASRCHQHGWQPRHRATCALLASSVTPWRLFLLPPIRLACQKVKRVTAKLSLKACRNRNKQDDTVFESRQEFGMDCSFLSR